MIRVKHALENLMTSGRHFAEESEAKWRIVLINLIGIVGIANLMPLGIYVLLKGKTMLGLYDLLLTSFFLFNLVALRKGLRYEFIARSCIYLTAIFLIYLFLSGGFENTGHLWLYPFPLVAVFLLGSFAGTLATLLFILSCFGIVLLGPHLEGWATYSVSFCTRFFPSLLAVAALALIFEFLRKKYYQNLAYKNDALEKAVLQLKHSQTELEKVQAELEQRVRELQLANQAKSDFLANMSHELRTPLNHIIGFTELVVDQNFGSLNDVQQDYLGDVLHSSRHLLSLINDILDLSKIDAGKLELNASAINLPEVLKNSLVMVQEKAMKHGITLETDIEGAPGSIRADERKLRQILYNLLSNAVKFTPDGGRIILRARVDTDVPAVRISVTDTGIGIAAQDLTRIFDPFEQVESSANRRYQGTGLGLSLSRQLVELHGGRIWAQSRGTGKGATFAFTLPLVTGEERQ